jgi:two-component system, chemotaxis family, chemotaxis protein CheY
MFDTNSKILIVDDQLLARQVLALSLRANGYTNIVEAEDGAKALDLIRATVREGQRFGLILTDIHMPKLDGMSLLKACKEDNEITEIPIVMVTAETEVHVVVDALKIGALDYVKKPVTIQSLQKKFALLAERINTRGNVK